MTSSDPVEDIIGDYRAFAEMQRDRLLTRGIDIAPYTATLEKFADTGEWVEPPA